VRRWNHEVRRVRDADGLRWDFNQPDPGGLSRLECHHRLLAQSERLNRRSSRMPDGIRNFRSSIPYFPRLRP
jgi:hypothetical protein